jgi:phospholipid N-methyltransferase
MIREFDTAQSEWLQFFRRWLQAPFVVGAIAPSGRALARAMVEAAAPLAPPVLELGAGTGAFTRALFDAGLPLDALHAVERLPAFARRLRRAHPGLHVIEADAADLTSQHLPHAVGCIVSGLPLRAMPEARIEHILRAALARARPDASVVQFSYGWRCPVSAALRARLGLDAERVAWIARNLPPASVWRLQRSGATRA